MNIRNFEISLSLFLSLSLLLHFLCRFCYFFFFISSIFFKVLYFILAWLTCTLMLTTKMKSNWINNVKNRGNKIEIVFKEKKWIDNRKHGNCKTSAEMEHKNMKKSIIHKKIYTRKEKETWKEAIISLIF